MTSIKDPLGQAFIEFCESQGIKFIDSKTGEELDPDRLRKDEETNK